jgi:hypothetical protein
MIVAIVLMAFQFMGQKLPRVACKRRRARVLDFDSSALQAAGMARPDRSPLFLRWYPSNTLLLFGTAGCPESKVPPANRLSSLSP